MNAMQQTSFDRWLRKKYVYLTYVYANSVPRTIPDGVTMEETTQETGGMYLYRFGCPTDQLLNELTARLEVENITYTSRIAHGDGLNHKLFDNPNSSFTMQLAWLIFTIVIAAIMFSGLPKKLWEKYSAVDEDEPGKNKRASIESVEESSVLV